MILQQLMKFYRDEGDERDKFIEKSLSILFIPVNKKILSFRNLGLTA
jgi:hypothetical protein